VSRSGSKVSGRNAASSPNPFSAAYSCARRSRRISAGQTPSGAVGVKRSPQERAFALELFGRYLFPVIGSGTVNSGISSPPGSGGRGRPGLFRRAEDRPFGTGLPRTPAQPAVAVVPAATPVAAASERRKWRRSMSLPDVRGCP